MIFNKLVTISSLYIPPGSQLLKTDLQNFIDEFPEPYIVAGDFNAHSTLWGDCRCDARGRLIENFLFSSGACLLNKKEPTFYSLAHKTFSSIDLTIVSSTLVPYLEWSVIRNPYGSDHFPIVLNCAKQDENTPHAPRWKVDSADWKRYRELTYLTWDDICTLHIDDAVAYVTAFLVDAASICIPETNGTPSKRRVPWWNDECREARRKQNKAWSRLRDSPTTENLIIFKEIKAQGRRTRRRAKRDSWQKYISSINSYRDERKAWNRVKKLKGRQSQPLPLVNTERDTLKEQADTLGAHFEYISSSSHYSDTFLSYQRQAERVPLVQKSRQTEPYNHPFNMAEFQASLNCCNNSAPGTD